ncbi:hypothetical protein Tco_0445690 [Tanacetum coccineum]
MFMHWYFQKLGKTELTKADLKGQAYEFVKPFYPDIVQLQFQMEECHKMLTDQIDWANPEGDQVRIDISKPLPLSGPPGHINEVYTYDISASFGISHWWFNRQKFYINRDIADSSHKLVRTHMRILNVVRIKAYYRYGYDYLKEITLHKADYKDYTIAEKDFKNLYPSDFEDLNLLLLQGQLNHLSGSEKRMLSIVLNLTKPGWDATGFKYKHDYTIIELPRAIVFPIGNNKWKIMRFNEIYKFSYAMLTNIMEALDFRVKEYKNIRVIPKYHSEDGNPARANIQQSLGSIKVKEIQDQISSFQDLEMYEHVGPQDTRPQDGERSQDDDQRIDLADDLKKAQDHISSLNTSHKTKTTTSKYKISSEESKTTS